MDRNPYQAPAANLFGSTLETSTEAVPQEAILQLQRTKPWVRFIGVLMWLVVGFMLLGGVGVVVAGLAGLGSAVAGGGGAREAGLMMGVATVYALMAVLYIYPVLKIWKFGSSIGRLVASRDPRDLVAALDQQRAFWKFVGIVTLIGMVLYGVMLVGAIGASLLIGGKAAGAAP